MHTYTCIYMHVHTYTCICIHIQTSANRCQVVFLRGGSRRHRASGWTPTYQTCCDRPWDRILVRRSCMGDLHEEREGGSRGPVRYRVVGCAKSSLHKRCTGQEKADAQMPRDALSVARLLPPLETVFRGFGICSRFGECHLRKYMHIHTKYLHIHAYTYIYMY